jgi:hypothetical protein
LLQIKLFDDWADMVLMILLVLPMLPAVFTWMILLICWSRQFCWFCWFNFSEFADLADAHVDDFADLLILLILPILLILLILLICSRWVASSRLTSPIAKDSFWIPVASTQRLAGERLTCWASGPRKWQDIADRKCRTNSLAHQATFDNGTCRRRAARHKPFANREPAG